MGIHPNAILMAVFTPDEGSRKTFRAICAEIGDAAEVEGDGQLCVEIGGERYRLWVMERDYEEGMQISAPEGSIVAVNMTTYGYGVTKAWDDLAAQKAALEEWATGICERHQCTVGFRVTANYW